MDFLDPAYKIVFQGFFFFLLGALRPRTNQLLLNAVEFNQGRVDLHWCYLV